VQVALAVIEDSSIYRSKEQVLVDLSKALRFSPDSLEANRKGRLSKEQVKNLSGQCIQPAVLAIVLLLGPIIVWTVIESGRLQLPFEATLPALFTELTHVHDLMDAHGKVGGAIMLGSIVISLAAGVFMALRVPVPLYFDLLDRKVEAREGRVVAREETINRENGRDPIEKYFFSLRYLNMPVNLAAYRALENGSIYIIYLTHRSEMLVSIEPKMDNSIPAKAEPVKTSQA
jgi:hypothetical protein